MPTAAVTGASGHLGGLIAAALLRDGAAVRLLLRRTNARTLFLQEAGAAPAMVDFADARAIEAALAGVDVLFHAAAANTTATDDPAAVLAATEGLARIVLDAAVRAGVPVIVHTSSVVVLGRSVRPVPLDENARADSFESPYVRGKALADAHCDALVAAGADIRRLYPSWVVGPGDPGATPPHALIAGLVRKPAAAVPAGGVSIADADAVADAHLAAWRSRARAGRWVLGGDNVSFRDLYDAIARAAGTAAPRVVVGRSAGRAAARGLALAARALGVPPPVDPAYADAVIGRWSWYDSRKAVAELGYRIRPLAEIVGRAVQEARRRNARTHGLGGRRVAIADGPEARPPLLITGVPGWLGNRFVDAFVNGLPDGVPLPRRRVRLLVEPRHLDLLDLPAPFEIVPGDLLDRASLDRALRGIGAVYHLAGAIHPPRTAALHRINGEGTRGLIDACAAAGVRRVLMMSTDAVAGVGTRDRRIFDEATPDRPWGDYGVSKQAGERALLEATRAGRIDGTSLRGFWFFGDFAPPRQEGFLKMMGWRRQIVFGDGRNLRNVSLTCNLVRAFVMAETVPRTIGRWYWIGDARADYTVDEIYRTLCDGAGRPYRPLRVPGAVCALARVVDRAMARAGRLHPTIHGMGKFDRDITGTIDAARRDFGYAPVLSLAEWAARQGAR